MLSNFVINQQKLILTLDNIGLENFSSKIVQQWLNEQKSGSQIDNATIYLHSLSKLTQKCKDVSEIFHEISRLQKLPDVQYIFVWATIKNIEESFLVPYLEHLAELVLNIEDQNHLSILTKKSGGSVTNKYFQYQIERDSFSVREIKRESLIPKKIEEPTVAPEKLGTFKIGDLDKDELEAKNALTLPYELHRKKEEPKEAVVIYHPDSADDLDEEDPDDDLLI